MFSTFFVHRPYYYFFLFPRFNFIILNFFFGFPEQHPVRLPRKQERVCLKDTKNDDCPNKNNAYT